MKKFNPSTISIKINPELKSNDFLVIYPFFSDQKKHPLLPLDAVHFLNNRIKDGTFKTKASSVLIYFHEWNAKQPQKILFLCLGPKEKITPKIIRNSFATSYKNLGELTTSTLSIILPPDLNSSLQALIEGLLLSTYQVSKYKSKQSKTTKLNSLNFITSKFLPEQKIIAKNTTEICNSVNFIRDLINAPPNHIHVNEMAELAKQIAKQNRYKITVLDRPKLEKLGLNALLGVNRGSHIGAKLVILEHNPLGKKQKPLLIVGKGILFDSGGYSLKPANYMDWMNMDMAGSAVVLGIFTLLKTLNIKRNIIGVFPLTDNLIGPTAQRPSEIITTFSGKTVEIGNTDAEGRLVLADAISYSLSKYDVESIIDIATLTGACKMALGEGYAGLFTNNEQLKSDLLKSAEQTDESIWPLPLDESHHKAIEGKYADLNNIDNSGLAGASTAAAFIEEFVENKPWAHLDIAGTAFIKQPKPYDHHGASGFGLRLLLNYLSS